MGISTIKFSGTIIATINFNSISWVNSCDTKGWSFIRVRRSGRRKEGDVITIDGTSGRIILGKVKTVKPDITGDFLKVMNWADDYRKFRSIR